MPLQCLKNIPEKFLEIETIPEIEKTDIFAKITVRSGLCGPSEMAPPKNKKSTLLAIFQKSQT